MNNYKLYFVVSKTFNSFDFLSRLFLLIFKHEINYSIENTIIKIEDLSLSEINKLRISYDAIKNDLELDDLTIICTPFFKKEFELIIDDFNKSGFYFIDEVFYYLSSKNSLKIDLLITMFDNIKCEILQTVKYYIELNHSLIDTARMMFAHRNTINYRINKFIDLTGIDVHNTVCSRLIIYILSFMKI